MNHIDISFFDKLKKSERFLLLLGGAITCGVLVVSIFVTMGTGFSNVWAGIILTIIFALIFFVSSKSYLFLMLAILPVFELDIFISRSSLFFLGTQGFNIISAIYLELISLTVFYFLSRWKFSIWNSASFRPLMLFSLFVSLNLFFIRPYQWFVLRQWLRLMGWVSLLLLVAAHVQEREDIQKLVSAAALGLFFPLLGALWSLLTGARTGLWLSKGYGIYEIAGWYPPGHALAKTLFSLFPYVIFLTLVLRARNIFYLILGGCVFVSIFYAYVRTTWVGLFVFFAVLLVLGIIRSEKRYIYLTLLGIVLTAILLYMNIESVVRRSPDLITPLLFGEAWLEKFSVVPRYAESVTEMGSGRIGVWMTLLRSWSDSSLKHKLFGQGIASVPKILKMDYGAHNDYIDLLLETGLIGLALYWWFLIAVLKRLFLFLRESRDDYYRTLACCSIALFFSFIFMSLFEAHIYAQMSQLYIAGFIGIAIGASENLPFRRKSLI